MSTRRHLPSVGASLAVVAAGLIALVGLLLVTRVVLDHPSSTRAKVSLLSGQVTVPPAAYIPDAPILARKGWTATASDQSAGHPTGAALDSNALTFWNSQGRLSPTGPSQWITIDLGTPRVVSSLLYEPRQGTMPVGAIGQFEISVSTDGIHFRTMATGTWANTTTIKQVGIDAVKTRFVRLTARSDAAGTGSDITAAEIYLRGTPHVAPSKSDVKLSDSTSEHQPGRRRRVGADHRLPARAGGGRPPARQPDAGVVGRPGPRLRGQRPRRLTQTAILNLTTGVVSEDTVTNTDHNMFCPGVAILANGDVMVTGGLSDQQTSIYDPHTNSWSAGPPMNIGRGYQGMTLLSNGQAFTLGGSWSGGIGSGPRQTGRGVVGHRRLAGADRRPGHSDVHPGRRQGSTGPTTTVGSSPPRAARSSRPGPSKQMNWITTTGIGQHHPGRAAGHQRRRHERQCRLLRHRQGHHHGRGPRLPGLERHQQRLRDRHQERSEPPRSNRSDPCTTPAPSPTAWCCPTARWSPSAARPTRCPSATRTRS